jgi:hypothetical protein
MENYKICSKCHIPKEYSSFFKSKRNKDGLRCECKECKKLYIMRLNINEQEHRKEKRKLWTQSNQDFIKISRKKWADKNQEKELERKRKFNVTYYQKNKKRISDYANNKQKEYRRTNLLFRVKTNLRSRINKFIKHKTKRTEQILGISYPEFIKYIENKFTNGMSWENYGVYGWHIDHKLPISMGKTEEEIYKLSHYTNLQPMWRMDNLKKSNKILDDEIKGLF